MNKQIKIFRKNKDRRNICCFFASFEKATTTEIRDILKNEIEKTIKEGYSHFLISVVREIDIITAQILSQLKQRYKYIFVEVLLPSKEYIEIEGAEEIIQASDKVSVLYEKIFDGRKKERNFLHLLRTNSKKTIIISYIQDFGVDVHCIFNKKL